MHSAAPAPFTSLDSQDPGSLISTVLDIRKFGDLTCPICMDLLHDPASPGCGEATHSACRSCHKEWSYHCAIGGNSPSCPICRVRFTAADLANSRELPCPTLPALDQTMR